MSVPAPVAEIIRALRADTLGPEWFRGRTSDDREIALSALVLGLAPMLEFRLRQWKLELEPPAMGQLRAAREAGQKRYAALTEQLGELLGALEAEGVRPLVLKGCHLAACVYPTPGLRPMSDIDLLFRPEELEGAHFTLLRLGYEMREKPAHLGPGIVKHTRTYRRPGPADATPNPYLSGDFNRTVEPHASLEESWFGLRCDITAGVLERSVSVQAAGWRGRGLGPEDLLLHLCVHLAFHLVMGAPSLVQLMDIDWVLRWGQPIMNWSEFLGRVAGTRSTPFVYVALFLADRTWGSAIPGEVLQALSRECPEAVRRHAERLSLEEVLARTQRAPLRTLGQRVLRGFQDRSEAARWAADLSGKWHVWRTLFAINRTDTGRMLMGRARLAPPFKRGAPKKSRP